MPTFTELSKSDRAFAKMVAKLESDQMGINPEFRQILNDNFYQMLEP